MTSTEQNIGTGDDPYFEGDSLEVTVPVTKDNGDPKNLTGATPEWAMSESAGAEENLSEQEEGVDVSVTDEGAGEVTLTIDAGVTDEMTGSWQHEIRLTDADGDKAVITTGRIVIQPRVNR